MEPYAELILYGAVCDSIGQPEGNFEDPFQSITKQFTDNYMKCLSRVKEAIEWKEHDGDVISRGGVYITPDSLIKTKATGDTLASYCLRSFERSEEWLTVKTSGHGAIHFVRSIRFKGTRKNQLDELIVKLQLSGVTQESGTNAYEEWKRWLRFRYC